MKRMHDDAKTIKGWFSKREGFLLYKTVKNMKVDGDIIEIGSYEGKSTFYIANGLKENFNINRKIHSIDLHSGGIERKNGEDLISYNNFLKNLKRFNIKDIVNPIIGESVEESKKYEGGIALLFIDGSHEYDDVKNDFISWSKKIVSGGYIAFHDTITWKGVKKAIDELIINNNEFVVTGYAHSLLVFQKKKRGFKDYIYLKFIMLYKNMYEILFLTKKRLTK